MQRLRLRYAKRGRLRFTSHRDVARAFERALRRAAVPMAFSAGFTPHQKISWLGAAPTGVASEAEYVEIGLAEWREPEAVRAGLDASLPPGLDVLACVEAVGPALAERLDTSLWSVRLPGVPVGTAGAALAAFMAAETVSVQRRVKDGVRTVDARSAVRRAEVTSDPADGDSCAILRLVVRQATPAVRTEDVLAGLRSVASLEPPLPAEATRLWQGLYDDSDALVDPLAPLTAGRGGREDAETRESDAVGA